MVDRAMYERHFGEKYAEVASLSTAEIAKLIRADIKQAVKLEVLPGVATDYSVRSDTFSGGSSIDVNIHRSDFWVAHENCHSVYCPGDDHKVLSEEGEAVKKTVEWLHGRYNYDGSESQVDYFDVNYYGTVSVETEHGRDFRLKEKARLAQNKADAAAKKEAIAKVVALSPYYKAGRLRTWSLANVEALLVQLEERTV